MRVDIHATGSSGNCVTIDDFIMIDAGVEVKKDVSALLITHHHTDHTKALAKYAGVSVWATQETIDKLQPKHPFVAFNTLHLDRPHKFFNPLTQAHYKVRCVPLKHDAPCVGFDITRYDAHGTKRILYATDFNSIERDINVDSYDALYIECNNTLSAADMADVYFGDTIPKDEFHRRKSFGNHCNADYLIGLFRRAGYSCENKYDKPVTLLHKSSYYYATNPDKIVELCKIAHVVNPVDANAKA